MIKLTDVEKIYETPSGKIHALKGINLEIKRGEIFGIIGLSGAGKSTLVRCINMLERPTRGTVIVDGKDLTTMNDSKLRRMRRQIGMIFQHFNLLSSATVFDNVAFPLRLISTPEDKIKSKVEELLEIVGLKDKSQQYPSQLSGGQKQRVGIARALTNDPKVLLCDEATSALDPQTTKSILNLIRDINRKLELTVVVITHEMQVVKDICSRVAVIENGIIAEEGSVVEIFSNPQKEITREFISVVLSNDLPVAFRESEIKSEKSPGSLLLVRLIFIGDSADYPVLEWMIRAVEGVNVTMLFGNLDQISGIPFGRMIIGLSGDDSRVELALTFLRAQDLKMEVIGYVQRRPSTSNQSTQ